MPRRGPRLNLPGGARRAIEAGLALRLKYEIEIDRVRRYLPDPGVASLLQSYELSYHALSQRYLLRNLNSGEQQDFGGLPAALDRLSTVRALPLIDASLLDPGTTYEIRVRAELTLRSAPDTLSWLLSGPTTGAPPAIGTHGRTDPEAGRSGGGHGRRGTALAVRDPVHGTDGAACRAVQPAAPWILMINVAGLVVLLALLATKLTQLVRDWRGHVIGSRLKARMCGPSACSPRCRSCWCTSSRCSSSTAHRQLVQRRDSPEPRRRAGAVALALETRMRDHLAATEMIASELSVSGGPMPGNLEMLRRQAGATEIIVASEGGVIVAMSKGLSNDVVPDEVPGEVLLQVRQGRPFVSLEPLAEGGYLIRTAVRSAPPRGIAAAWWCRRPTRSRSGSAPWPIPCRRPTSSSARRTTCASRSRRASS